MLCKAIMVLFIAMCAWLTQGFSEIEEKKKVSTEKQQKNPVVILKTNKGFIKIELYPDKAPLAVANFLKYVNDGQYNNTIFHRIINGFMIQGGGFTVDFKQKPTRAPIKIEANNGLLNERGSVAMARTSDPNSASSQFFINLTDNDFLNFKTETSSGWGYTVFGKVIDGMDVVDQIKDVKTGNFGGHSDVPIEPVVIESAVEVKD